MKTVQGRKVFNLKFWAMPKTDCLKCFLCMMDALKSEKDFNASRRLHVRLMETSRH